MSQTIYKVQASWDREAEVWVAESEDIPGLVTEAETIEALTAKLHQIIPELLELNRIARVDDRAAISFELIGRRQELIRGI
jgi:predicted RNase H-like HicB family nuclease